MFDYINEYKKMVSAFKNDGFGKYVSFMRFLANTNAIEFTCFNQILLYSKVAAASSQNFFSFDECKNKGIFPKVGSNIEILHNDGSFSHVFSIPNIENKQNRYDDKFVDSFLQKNVLNDSMKKLCQQISISDSELKDFLDDSIKYIISYQNNKRYVLSEKYECVFNKILQYKDSLFVWVHPEVSKYVVKLEKELAINYKKKEEQKYVNGKTADAVKTTVRSERVQSSGFPSTKLPNAVPNFDDNRSGGEHSSISPERSKETTKNFTERSNIEKKSKQNNDKNSDGNTNRGKDSISPYRNVDEQLEKPWNLMCVFNEEYGEISRFLTSKTIDEERSSGSKNDMNIYLLGKFPTYKVCSEACSFFDKLDKSSKEYEKLKIFPNEYSGKKNNEVSNLFTSMFHEQRNVKMMNYVRSDFYKSIYNTALNENRNISTEEAALLYALKKVDECDYKDYLFDLFSSDLSEYKIGEYIENSGVLGTLRGIDFEETGENKYIKITFVPVDSCVLCEDASKQVLSVPLNIFCQALSTMLLDSDYDIQSKEGKICSNNEVDLYTTKFFKKFNITRIKSCVSPFSRSKKASLEDMPTEYKNKMFSLTWYDKFKIRNAYKNSDYNQLKDRILGAFMDKANKEPYSFSQKDTSFLGFAKDKNSFAARWLENKILYEVKMDDTEVFEFVENKLEKHIFLDLDDYKKRDTEFFQNIAEFHKKCDPIGMPAMYYDILNKIRLNKYQMTDREIAVATVIRIFLDSNHYRDRKYIGEVFSQNNLSDEDLKDYLKIYMDKYLFKYFGSFGGMIRKVTEDGVELSGDGDIFSPDIDSCYGEGKFYAYERLDLFITFNDLISVFNALAKQPGYIENAPSYEYLVSRGSSGRTPDGFIDFYNEFKDSHNFSNPLFDTHEDVDFPMEHEHNKNNKIETEKDKYEQMDLFSFVAEPAHKEKII